MKANERWRNLITSKRNIIWWWPFYFLLVHFLFRFVCSRIYSGWMDPNYSHGSRCTMRASKFKTKFLGKFWSQCFPDEQNTFRINAMMPLIVSLQLNFWNLLDSCNIKYHHEFLFWITVSFSEIFKSSDLLQINI